MRAYCAYIDLINDNMGPEGFVLWIYFNAINGIAEGMPEAFKKSASELAKLDPNDQIDFSAKLLHDMKKADSADR